MQILIAGVPRAGKTTLAERLGGEHRLKPLHTDDLIDLGWSGASSVASSWMSRPGSWILEGVAVPRALRKWLVGNSGVPADVVYWLESERETLAAGQLAMAAGCRTVWGEILPDLTARGTRIELA